MLGFGVWVTGGCKAALRDEKTGKEQICEGGNLELPIRHASFYCTEADAEPALDKQTGWDRKLRDWIMGLGTLTTQSTFSGL